MVLSSLEIQKRVIQTKYTTSFFTLSEKKGPPNFQVATAKNFFSSVYVIITTCFNKWFLLHVITGRHLKDFFDSQFNYAPLIWMFCRKGLYLKMQKIHHKTLKVIYQSNKTYEELLELSETVSTH